MLVPGSFKCAPISSMLKRSKRVAESSVVSANETTTIELRWRASDDGIKNGRLGLWFDGRLAQDAQGLDNAGIQIESVRLGAWGLGGLLSGAFYVDNFEAWSAVEAQ